MPEYYANLLSSAYRGRPKATGEINALESSFGSIVDSARGFREILNLETASGVHLDRIGHWLGVRRPYQYQSEFMQFGRRGVPGGNAEFGLWHMASRTEQEGGAYASDAQYRSILHNRTEFLAAGVSVYDLDLLLRRIAGVGYQAVSGQILIFLDDTGARPWLDFILQYLPRAAGITYTIIRAERLILFGDNFDRKGSPGTGTITHFA